MNNKETNSKQQSNKKASSSTIIVVLITLIIAIASGSSSAANAELEKVLKHKVETEKLSVGIAVAIIENGQVSFINVGVANKETAQEIDQNTLFEIGSVSKVMTSTALATFVDEGTLKLSDPVQNYLPKSVKLPMKNDKAITFESLASHRSGLPRLPSNMQFSNPLNPYVDYTTEMMYEFLNQYTLPREVGESPEYSNLAVGLLGHTLAKIDDMNYEQMLMQRVLKPLKMKDTFVDVPKSALTRRSKGHNGNLETTDYWQLPAMAGAGAVVSDATDMALYLKANMQQNELASAIKLTHQPTAEFGNSLTKVGLGWIIQGTADGDVYMHNGQTGGFASFIGFNPTSHKGIVILSNTSILMDEVGYSYLTNSLASLKLTTPVKVAEAELAKLIGRYELVPGFILSITHDEDKLFVQGTGQPRLPLTANSINEFVNNAVKARIQFELDANGIATSLTMYQGGQTLPGKKLK
ncbi:serine hydrolase [Pseudoalteromonas atlantica]|uniref:serine hydrolase n=1 Tax=Pseudoalteromonas atlantica TaxID=288 RepID=UPI0037352884